MARKEKYYITKAESLEYKCCICGKDSKGFGNDPYPVHANDTSRCCDACYMEVVIPTKMNILLGGGNLDGKE